MWKRSFGQVWSSNALTWLDLHIRRAATRPATASSTRSCSAVNADGPGTYDGIRPLGLEPAPAKMQCASEFDQILL